MHDPNEIKPLQEGLTKGLSKNTTNLTTQAPPPPAPTPQANTNQNQTGGNKNPNSKQQ